MKNISYILLIMVCVTAACKKDIEQEPKELLTEDLIFDPVDRSGTYAEQFLNGIYSSLPTGFNRVGGNFLDASTDDAISSQDGTSIENLSKGRVSASSHPDDAWAKNYTGIRKANLFLSKVDRTGNAAEVRSFWKAEARFLRAMFYFELLKRYGGVPLVGDTVFNYTDDLRYERNTFAECVDYIVQECDAIKDLVRPDPLSTNDWGRASKGIVMTLKARVLLYAASPLFNGGVVTTDPQRAALQGYPSYDANRWDAAAKACKDVIDLNIYGLESNYLNIFTTRRSTAAKPEVILAFLRNSTTDVERNNGPIGFANQANGEGRTSPTQELVDAFPMKDGTPIAEAADYDPGNPYVNRDPRLGHTVLYNGVKWLNRPLETFDGGLDKPDRNVIQTKTSYYLRKFMGNFTSATQYANTSHNFIIFRYADVVLGYAEALNEFAGPSDEVYQQLKDIRKRGGITAGADNMYGLEENMSKEDMREAVRGERRRELAFEEHRYWDLRRWKTAEQELNKDLTGMKITALDGGGFSYERVTAGKVMFAPHMYLYPIPFSEISKNANLLQNSGW
ncbi:RagB/SusD family nutrient uptake outer membrane protein [Chitinophaga cymbidii]|uniref:Starch-binding protein n=1 Tax=Chitinophaga cymbidii TaxID=1096750 RepID=A0A512RE92_9BACT|nr:RagB/SusD family nutrient uptake outer membrane protein [Chitinophaga cymbidii]GEP94013.1 hypothetical protein CCY01nite_02730 [Chitinophaga cymbidii]